MPGHTTSTHLQPGRTHGKSAVAANPAPQLDPAEVAGGPRPSSRDDRLERHSLHRVATRLATLTTARTDVTLRRWCRSGAAAYAANAAGVGQRAFKGRKAQSRRKATRPVLLTSQHAANPPAAPTDLQPAPPRPGCPHDQRSPRHPLQPRRRRDPGDPGQGPQDRRMSRSPLDFGGAFMSEPTIRHRQRA
jgi:hypothetical protein